MRKQRQPERLTFFVDADLGLNFFRALSVDERFTTEFLGNHFPNNADDDEWISFIAQHGWIAVTHDKKVRRQHRSMIARTSARIIIVAGNRSLESQARNFCESYARIERFVRKHKGPYTAKLHQPSLRDEETKLRAPGRIEIWGTWETELS